MSRMSRFVLSVVLLTAVTAWAQPVATAPVAVGDAPAGNLAGLRTRAMAQLSAGEFQAGAQTIEQVLNLAPEDATALQAREWLAGYLERRTADEATREAEHGQAVAKAQALLRIAQAWEQAQPRLAEGRQAANKAQSTFTELHAALAPTVVLGEAEPADLAERIRTDTQTVVEKINAAAHPLTGLTEPWAQDIRSAAAEAQAAVEAYATQATDQPWATPDEQRASRRALARRNEQAEDALATLAVYFSRNPWRSALDQARLAKESAADRESFRQAAWLQPVVSAVEARAAEHREAHEWFDALALYSGLAEMDGSKRAYRDEIDAVSQHVRVVALYAPDKLDRRHEGDAAADESAEGEDEDPRVAEESVLSGRDWRDRIEGIDGDMVRQIIAQVHESYVTTVDFRQALVGALEAVRVLVEAPELRETFPGLADGDARGRFLTLIDGQITEARQRSTVPHFYVEAALSRLSQANRRTVRLDDEVIYLEFAEGLLRQLDEFSSMIWPADWQDFKKQTMGRFYGVGIQIQMENGLLKVVSPLEDSPAYAAGIQAGDYVIGIDGKSARNIDIDTAVKNITGAKGTQVVLTIQRPGQAEPFDVPLVRDEIHVQTVKGWKRIEDGQWDWMVDPQARIGYLRMTSFTQDTPGELHAALDELKDAGVRGLILDLRFNPGGYLQAATAVADEFIRRGILVSTDGRQQPKRTSNATAGGAFLDGEVVVLVNGLSASAAEIVSGAMKDWQRATVVGNRSFGKGSVQNLIQIQPDRAYLKLTTAHYYLPKGRCLHRTEDSPTWGVEPDLQANMTPRQLRRWLELRRDTEILQDRDPEQLDGEMAEQYRADIQLDTAVTLLRMKLLEQKRTAGPVETAAN